MKNIFILLTILFLGSCKEKKEISQKYNSQDLDFIERFEFTTDLMFKNDKKILKMYSVYDYTNNNKKLMGNLWKEDFFEGKILIPNKFKGNTIPKKAYSIDDNGKIVILYESSDQFLTFKIQRNKENYENSQNFGNHVYGVLLKDLDKDGLKEIIVLSDSNTDETTFYQLNVYSIFK